MRSPVLSALFSLVLFGLSFYGIAAFAAMHWSPVEWHPWVRGMVATATLAAWWYDRLRAA